MMTEQAPRATLSGHSILCFAPGPWHDLWRSRHQIMRRLAQTNTVLWIEPRLTLRATLTAPRGGATQAWASVERVADGLHVMHNPALLPASGPAPLRGVAGAIHHSLVRRSMARLGMTHPILWLYLPEMAGIIGQYGERLVVYHVVDEYTAYAGIPAAYVAQMRADEARLLQRADVVFVTAPALLESKKRLNANVHLVPNAVDYDGFQRTLAAMPLPVSMSHLPPPVIGYVGAINDKLDYGLLVGVARLRPQWTLALVGPVDVRTPDDSAGVDMLRDLPNVHLLGAVHVADVPRYIAACHVCLLPYKINERTRNISSLKLYEYLACGKPVVSTDVPAAREGGGEVRLAGDPSAFVEAIQQAMSDDAAAAHRRQQLAAANTWEHRVAAISAILSEHLGRSSSALQRAS